MRVLLDSNVCFDFLLARPDDFVNAAAIFSGLKDGDFEGFVCSVTFTTIHYVVRKVESRESALLAVDTLMKVVEVCPVDRRVLEQARLLAFKDYEDAVQCASAVAEGLDAIVTRNTRDFEQSPIPVYSPAEFLGILQQPSA
jgi:predicted nucleic acid-binding protein